MNGKQWTTGALVSRLAVPNMVELPSTSLIGYSGVSAPGSHPAHVQGQKPTTSNAPIAHRKKLRLREESNLSLV